MHPIENKEKVTPSNIVQIIDQKFKSSNIRDVPGGVSRASITKHEWDILKELLLRART